ncbi:MAG: hypothetical protein AUH86_04510 [Acidobacteria bacterium 13_1_40CM_4_58_4]|nr:MAG: hypothetical protein AUH86_04510 [Acidobacteria bacterium 13_1_40CM_4_58_4]
MCEANCGLADYAHTRRWNRYKVDVPLRVIVGNERKATIVYARGTSLSEGGMAMFASAELRPGDQVAVEFTPPYSAPPINRQGYTYGVEFLTDSSSQIQGAVQLRKHLASLIGLNENPS